MSEETKKEPKPKKTPQQKYESKRDLLMLLGIVIGGLLIIFLGLKIGIAALSLILFFLGVR